MTNIKSYQLKNKETRYKFYVYVGIDPLTGKEQTTTKNGFKTKKEAKEALLQIQQEIRNGTFRKQAFETYRDVYELWMEHYENTVEDRTLLKTKRIFKNHILPMFADYKIAKIDVAICQKHVNQWAKKLKRFRMVKNYSALVMKYAIKHGLIDKNPFDLVEMPIIKSKINLEDEDEEFENFYSKLIFIKKKDLILTLKSNWYFQINIIYCKILIKQSNGSHHFSKNMTLTTLQHTVYATPTARYSLKLGQPSKKCNIDLDIKM